MDGVAPAMTVLTQDERMAIRSVAAGDRSGFAVAKAAYDRAARLPGAERCAEIQFMREVVSETPDLLLRAFFRSSILSGQSRIWDAPG
jgi:hypothetical protein